MTTLPRDNQILGLDLYFQSEHYSIVRDANKKILVAVNGQKKQTSKLLFRIKTRTSEHFVMAKIWSKFDENILRW